MCSVKLEQLLLRPPHRPDAHMFRSVQDLLSNPLIVPVKILRGHEVVDFEGVLDCAFHPTQPWIFTAGADASICLFTNP